MNQNPRSQLLRLLPVFFAFAVMGFIDITGVATSYVKQDFGLSDRMANLLPGMTMIWFILISLPTAALMRRIGRKNTVTLSLGVMLVALALPLLGYSLALVMTAFALLGIGNTILQVSLNPLLKNIVAEQRMTSSITFGQFVKAIVSLLGPILIGLFAAQFGSWRLIFPVYAVAMLLSLIWLALTPIQREAPEAPVQGGGAVFALLRDSYLRACFMMIVLVVGFEICMMTVVPKLMLAKYAIPIEQGGLGCSLYYAAKTLAALAGTFILAKVSPLRYLIMALVITLAAFVAFGLAETPWATYVALGVVGLAAANVFSVVFSVAMQHRPEQANGISALMITGVAGGALLPPVMGALADAAGLEASLAVPLAAVVCMLAVTILYLRKN